MQGFRLYEVVPVLVETSHVWASGVVCFAAGFWNRLSPEEREVFETATRESAIYFNQLIEDDERASMNAAIAAGASTVQPEDRPEREAKGRRLWPLMADAVGGRIQRIATDLQ